MHGYGYVNSNVCEAVSAVKSLPGLKDYELITYSKVPIREIALKGHDIGSHSYFHEGLDTEKNQLEEALVNFYTALHQVI